MRAFSTHPAEPWGSGVLTCVNPGIGVDRMI